MPDIELASYQGQQEIVDAINALGSLENALRAESAANRADYSAEVATTKAGEASTSATTATTKATDASVYATNAASSATTANTIATALTDIYNDAIDQGTVVAPAIDYTLSVSGAAADARTTGAILDSISDDYSVLKIYTSSTTFSDGFYNSSGTFVSNVAWQTATTATNIVGGKKYRYIGCLNGTVAGIALFDSNNNIVQHITAPSSALSNNVYTLDFVAADNASYLYYAYRLGGTPPCLALLAEKKEKNYDVVIVGSGAAGIGAAYALRDSGYKVALIEKESRIGGSHIQAWVNGQGDGVPPKYLSELNDEMLIEGASMYTIAYVTPVENTDETLSWIWGKYRTDGETRQYVINFNQDVLYGKYHRDLKGVVDIYTSSELVKCTKDGQVVKSVTTNDGTTFNAKVFIDSTGDDVLLRKAGLTLLVGEESKTYFQADYGFTESCAPDTSYPDSINVFTLLYRIMKGDEDLSDVTAAYDPDGLISPIPFNYLLYVNNISYMQLHGYELLNHGAKWVYNTLKPRLIQQWKNIKVTNPPRFEQFDLSTKRYDTCAPMLGIRESYRALCERMLSQNDLWTKLVEANITNANGLDCYIACGSHGADIHGFDNHCDLETINDNMQVYGVKYGSLIPVGLKNVFVASRGAGFTHIGASSFRMTKDMAMIGNFAGWSARYMLDHGLTDTRDVNVATVQGRTYADILDRLKTVAKMIE